MSTYGEERTNVHQINTTYSCTPTVKIIVHQTHIKTNKNYIKGDKERKAVKIDRYCKEPPNLTILPSHVTTTTHKLYREFKKPQEITRGRSQRRSNDTNHDHIELPQRYIERKC